MELNFSVEQLRSAIAFVNKMSFNRFYQLKKFDGFCSLRHSNRELGRLTLTVEVQSHCSLANTTQGNEVV